MEKIDGQLQSNANNFWNEKGIDRRTTSRLPCRTQGCKWTVPPAARFWTH